MKETWNQYNLTHKLTNHVSALFLEYFLYAVMKFPILKAAGDIFFIALDPKLSWLIDWDHWGNGERILKMYRVSIVCQTWYWIFFYIYSHLLVREVLLFLLHKLSIWDSKVFDTFLEISWLSNKSLNLSFSNFEVNICTTNIIV